MFTCYITDALHMHSLVFEMIIQVLISKVSQLLSSGSVIIFILQIERLQKVMRLFSRGHLGCDIQRAPQDQGC